MNEFLFLEVFGDVDEKFIEQAGKTWKRKKGKHILGLNNVGIKVACALIIVTVLLGGVFRIEIKAAWEKFSTMIGQVLGVTEDLSLYTEIKDIPITQNGITLTLREVILDNDEMLILFSTEGTKGKEIAITGDVWIDNQSVRFQESYLTDADYDLSKAAQSYVLGYYLGSDIKVNDISEIKAVFSIRDENDLALGEYEYAFTASKEEMEKNTEKIELNQMVEAEGVIDFRLNKLTINSINSRIYGECTELDPEREYFLIGNDDCGNKVIYNMAIFENPELIFVKDNDSYISPEATILEMQLFVRRIQDEEGLESVEDGDVLIEDFMEDVDEKLEEIGDKLVLDLRR